MKDLSARIQEFCKYHREGDGECNTVVLCRWADVHGLSFQQRYELAFYFSITYSVISAIAVYQDQRRMLKDIDTWVQKYKPLLIFQSDRKYMKMKDSFNRTLKYWKAHLTDGKAFVESVSKNGRISLEKAIQKIQGWEMFGRFSAFLFLEMFVNLTKAPIENTTIVWKDGNTATSGLLNLFTYDNAANEFDRTGRLLIPAEKMDKMLLYLIEQIGRSGGSTNVTEIETSLCAYRKFYKGSRYNGYYLDRMLEEVNQMKGNFPEICKEILEIRQEAFDRKYLGEFHGWKKIRPDMKKLYKRTGIIS